MQSYSLSHYAIFILVDLGIAVWLTAILTAIFDLSWAKIRKLNTNNRKNLIEHSKLWMEQRRNLRVIIRLLSFTTLAALSIICYQLVSLIFTINSVIVSAIICGLLTALIFLLVTEIFGNGLLAAHKWRLLSISSPALRLFYSLMNPILSPVLKLQHRLNSLREDESGQERATTVDEIISLVEQDAYDHRENGDLEASERRMIRGIIDLDETFVKEIMTPRVDMEVLDITASIAEAKKKIIQCGHSRIPVVNGRVDEIVGLVLAKDLLDDSKLRMADSIEGVLHPPVFIPATKNVSDLLDEFKQNKNHIAIIIDEYGGTAGIVTFEDILEEIVGEIQDEYDTDEDAPQYTMADDGSIVIDARMPIDDVNALLDISISEDEEYDTIGGYVSSELGRIPQTREVVELDGVQAQILDADARKISKLKLKKIDDHDAIAEVSASG